MALKTRLEILEKDHDSALDQLIENEINLTHLNKVLLTTPPGKDADEMQKLIAVKKGNIKKITAILEIVKEMLGKEEKNGRKKV